MRLRPPVRERRRARDERIVLAQRRAASCGRRPRAAPRARRARAAGRRPAKPSAAFTAASSTRGAAPTARARPAPTAASSARMTSVHGNGVWLRGCGPGWSVPARTTGAPPERRLKSATSLSAGLRPTIRNGMPSRLSASMIVTRRGRSSGSSSRSLTRIAIGLLRRSSNAIWCASSSPAEIFVPPLKVRCPRIGRERLRDAGAAGRRQLEVAHERREIRSSRFRAAALRRPGRRRRRGRSARRSARATTASRRCASTCRRRCSPRRRGRRSPTSAAGSVTIVSVCGWRETRAAAMTSPASVAASAIRTSSVRVAAGRSAPASASGIEVTRRPPSARPRVTSSAERVARRRGRRPGEVVGRVCEARVARAEQPREQPQCAPAVRRRPLLRLTGQRERAVEAGQRRGARGACAAAPAAVQPASRRPAAASTTAAIYERAREAVRRDAVRDRRRSRVAPQRRLHLGGVLARDASAHRERRPRCGELRVRCDRDDRRSQRDALAAACRDAALVEAARARGVRDDVLAAAVSLGHARAAELRERREVLARRARPSRRDRGRR